MTISVADITSLTSNDGTGHSASWSHTVTAVNSKQLTLTVALLVRNNNGGVAGWNGVSYGGVPLVRIAQVDMLEALQRQHMEIWSLPNPTVGTATIQLTGVNTTTANFTTFTGLSETINSDLPLVWAEQNEFSTISDTSGSQTLSTTLTTQFSTATLFDWFASNFNQSQTVASGQTEIINIPNAGTLVSRLSHSMKGVASPAASTMGWTCADTFRRGHIVIAAYETSGMLVADIIPNRIFQRTSRTAGNGPVSVTAFTNLTNAPASLEARIMRSGTVVQDWVTGSGFTLVKGRPTATITVPVGSGYNIEVRLKKSDASVIDSTAKTNIWHMGSNYCFIGSSTMERAYTAGTLSDVPAGMTAAVYSLGNMSTTFGTLTNWTLMPKAREGVLGFLTAMNNYEPNVPVGILEYGFAGSTLKAWETPDGVNDNFAPAVAAVLAFGAEGTCMVLGGNDTTLTFTNSDVALTTQTDFETRYRSLLTKYRTAIGQAAHPFFIQGVQSSLITSSDPTESDRRYNLVRSATINVCNDANNYYVSSTYDLGMNADLVHLDAAGMATLFKRVGRAICNVNGALTNGYRGPRPTAVSYDPTSGWVRVFFFRTRGSGVIGSTGQTALSGITFASSGTSVLPLNPEGVFVSGTNEVAAKLPGGLTNVTVAIAAGRNPDKSNLLKDNAFDATFVRSLGAVITSKDGSVGQTYTAPSGMAAVQWYREALSSAKTQTAISGATSSTYVAQTADVGFRLVAKGQLLGATVDAVALQVVLPAPVLLDDFDSASNYTASNVLLTIDTTSPKQGSGSLRIDRSTTGTVLATRTTNFTIDGSNTAIDPSTLGVIALATSVEPQSEQQNPVSYVQFIRAGSTVGLVTDVDYQNINSNPNPGDQANGWHWHTFNVSEHSSLNTTGSGTLSARYRSFPTVRHDALMARAGGRPTVVFTFDDLFSSQYDIAFPYMQSKGLVGTIYVAPNSYVGKGGRLTLSQLQQFKAAGWGIGVNFTNDDGNITDRASAEAAALEAANVRKFLENSGLDGPDKNHGCYSNGNFGLFGTKVSLSSVIADNSNIITVASTDVANVGFTVSGSGIPANTTITSVIDSTHYQVSQNVPTRVGMSAVLLDRRGPFYNGKVQAALSAQGFLTGRTTLYSGSQGHFHSRFGIEQGMNLPACSTSMGSGVTVNQLIAQYEKAKLRGGTIIYYIHDIATTASAIGMTTAGFQQFVDYVAADVDSGITDCLTIGQLWARDGKSSVPFTTAQNGVRTLGIMTATKDGSVGQTYTAPSGMIVQQWYREALTSDLTKTSLDTTATNYIASSNDVGYRLVVRGMLNNVLVDAPAYDPVYAAPILVEAFDSTANLRVGNGTMANAAPVVQGSGSVELTGNGANNSVNVFRNTGQMLDLATVGTISMALDFGSDSLLQDGDYGGPGLNVATTTAAYDQGSGGSAIDASTGSNPITANMVGRRWMSYSIAEFNNLPAPGYAVPSARIGWKPSTAYAGKVKCDALVRNSGGRATIVLSADDGIVSQYSTLYPAFRDRGLSFTLFPARDNIAKGDAGTSAGFMTTAMLNEMYLSGLVDIGVDPYDDAPLTGDTDIAAALLHADVSRQWVLSKGWTRAANHMCYPNGSSDLSNRKTITDFTATGTAVITMASTTGLTAGMDVAGLGVPIASGVKIVSVDSATQITLNQNLAAGTYRVNCAVTTTPFFGAKLPQALTGAGWLTGRTTSPKLVADRFGITSDEAMTLTSQSMSNQTFADTKKYIDLAVKRGCMLYLYGHGWTATGGLNYSPSELILLADYLKSLKDQGLIDVSTISQWWNAASKRSFPL